MAVGSSVVGGQRPCTHGLCRVHVVSSCTTLHFRRCRRRKMGLGQCIASTAGAEKEKGAESEGTGQEGVFAKKEWRRWR